MANFLPCHNFTSFIFIYGWYSYQFDFHIISFIIHSLNYKEQIDAQKNLGFDEVDDTLSDIDFKSIMFIFSLINFYFSV